MKEPLAILLLVLLISSCNNAGPANEKTGDLTKSPDSLLMNENLIQYYREKGRYDSALEVIQKALLKDSAIPRLWQIKGTLEFENEDTLNAIRSFEKTVSLSPNRQYLISLGTLYAQTKNDKAQSIADSISARNPSKVDKDAIFIKGLYYTYLGNKQKAIGFFDLCVAMDYTFMSAYREKAIALYDQQKFQEALKVLEKAVTLQNSFEEGHYWEGRCLEKLNRINDAVDSYKTALQYDPNYIEAKDALARLGIK